MENAIWILLTAAVILSGVSTFLNARVKKQTELVALVKEQAYQLFLYAEKQDWIGPEKMDFVAGKIVEFIPSKDLAQVIGEQRISDWLQSLYEASKQALSK